MSEPNSSQSDTVKSLKSERLSLTNEIDGLKLRQDKWHRRYTALAIFAVLLGFLSWWAQKLESDRAYDQRPLISRLSEIDSEVGRLNKAASDTRIAALQEDTERERLLRVRLEAQVAWRRLSPAQAAKLAKSLKDFPGQHATILYNEGDPEGYAFAFDIASAVLSAKWAVPTPIHVPPSLFVGQKRGPDTAVSPPITGISVSSSDDEPNIKAAVEVAKALNSLGFTASLGTPQNWEAKYVSIKVEARPSGAQGGMKLEEQAIAHANAK